MSDSAWQPSASLDVLHGRAAMLARIRAYFAAQEVEEVQTPRAFGRGRQRSGHRVGRGSAGERTAPLPADLAGISDEAAARRGFGDCYQVCPVFRDGESGRCTIPNSR